MYVIDQGNIDPYSYLKSQPHRGAYISSPDHFIFFGHFTNTMVFLHVALYGYGLFIIAPSGDKISIRVDSFLSYPEDKLRVGLIPMRYNQSSTFL